MYNTYIYESIAAHEMAQRTRAAADYNSRGRATPRRRRARRARRQPLTQPSIARGQRMAQGR